MESTGLQSPNKGTHITLIDTPGFDYSRGNDEYTTLRSLAIWVKQRYGKNVKLDGVIYMHDIWNEEIHNRPRFLSSQDLEKLCGPQWHRKVILVSSHWDDRLGKDGEGESNERKLREGYWSFMIQKGSRMRRYRSPGNQELARDILQPFL
ncbi:hypothetical protein AGABI1DRAFT_77064 [Agaricus bisporus var. burnettii JB137-S8]|uniref:G domain-containing protein n=1 Tax=Agaricus bisporus var. burnettii (strain JB137-S8 / ATCC MYA-4627 / FGSC 10392) TaxID=597362 RepID=K5VT14_AGABU|nr:uncharacterized protein AGABI1DRAFT_77064 [Agaricus bisporus var. burnettii JB137-S8]EKM77569.1 hypothetical protein AGABI1DRAFT_77064 [Agaricus bisporus var. burnettii JB137-S8]